MCDVIEFKSKKEGHDSFDTKMFLKFRYEFYDQFLETVKKNSDMLICWNPLSNEEIFYCNSDIDIFCSEVARFSRGTDVFIHLGRQWLQQYEYDHLIWHGEAHLRWIEDFDFHPNTEGFFPPNLLKELYYMLVKPTIISSYANENSMVDLFYYDKIDGLIHYEDVPDDDFLNRVVMHTFLNQ